MVNLTLLTKNTGRREVNNLNRIMGAFSVKIDHIKYDAVQRLDALKGAIREISINQQAQWTGTKP